MFKLVKINNSNTNVPEPEFYEVTASEAVSSGEALILSSGKLTKCTATAKPIFVAMKSISASETARKIAVMRVTPNMQFETKFSAAPTSIVVGDKVTIATDALSVTATTTSGVITIADKLGATASGNKCLVYII